MQNDTVKTQGKHHQTVTGCLVCRKRKIKVNFEALNMYYRMLKLISVSGLSAMRLGLPATVRPFLFASISHKLIQSFYSGCQHRSGQCEYPSSHTVKDTQLKKDASWTKEKQSNQSQSQATSAQSSTIADDGSMPKCASPGTNTTSSDSISLIPPGSTLGGVTSFSQVSDLWCLSAKQQFYFNHLRQSIGCNHYFLEYNTTEFVRSVMASAALTFKPLFHAVVSFAAFHYSVHHATGNLLDSLESYMQSVSLLCTALQSNQPHTNAMILTILQLGTLDVSRI